MTLTDGLTISTILAVLYAVFLRMKKASLSSKQQELVKEDQALAVKQSKIEDDINKITEELKQVDQKEKNKSEADVIDFWSKKK
jgi:predicted nuclease with TOPRIM domain